MSFLAFVPENACKTSTTRLPIRGLMQCRNLLCGVQIYGSLCLKMAISWAPLSQVTGFDLWPLQGHFRSQVCRCSVAAWRTSFGRHIRLEFRYCGHLPDRLRRSPTMNDKFGISSVNMTIASSFWSKVKFWPWRFLVNKYMFRCVSIRETRWWQHYFDISLSSKVVGEKPLSAIKRYFDIS